MFPRNTIHSKYVVLHNSITTLLISGELGSWTVDREEGGNNVNCIDFIFIII